MSTPITKFWRSESGAITVDWVVLVSAAFGLATATTAMILATMQFVTSNLDAELREQQLSDQYVQFEPNAFDWFYDNGVLTVEEAEAVWTQADEMMNHELLTFIDEGVQMYADGDLTDDQLATLWAMLNVAEQRNIMPADAFNPPDLGSS